MDKEPIARAVRAARAPDPAPEPTMEFSIRTVTCACGGRYTAGGSSFNVMGAIQAHQGTSQHARWRLVQKIEMGDLRPSAQPQEGET